VAVSGYRAWSLAVLDVRRYSTIRLDLHGSHAWTGGQALLKRVTTGMVTVMVGRLQAIANHLQFAAAMGVLHAVAAASSAVSNIGLCTVFCSTQAGSEGTALLNQ
jgi:hypothetical protein